MNHEIEAHFAQYCYLLKSEDDAPGWSFAAEHADNRGIAIQMLSTYINNGNYIQSYSLKPLKSYKFAK